MPTIERRRAVYTVVVTVDADAAAMPDMEAHARAGLARFRDYDGYVGGALHRSDDGARLLQYVQWESAAAYRACQDDPAWERVPTHERFFAHLAAGRARIDERGYEVVDSSGPAGKR